jgi:P27 family predicted phage terminase small subunit
MAGRKPKPTITKQLNGNPGKRPLNHNEPKFSGTPTCPKHLSKAAKAEWKRISADLSAQGLLTNVDRAALAAYCAAWARWVDAEEQIAKFGAVIKSPKSGYPIQNPYVGIANTALQMMHRYLTEFGAGPASRTRIAVNTPPTSADPFAEFMASIGATEDLTHDDQTELQQPRT